MNIRYLLGVLAAALLLVGAVPAAARDRQPQPGLFVALGEAYIFRIEGGQPVAARRATADEQPQAGELKVTLSDSQGTNMVILNGSQTSYNYQAFVARDAQAGGTRTSVCTLMPGVTAFETWPQRLPGIRLTQFEPANGGMTCR